MINYLDKLQEKCTISDNFMDVINSLFDRLVDFGYISQKQVKKLSKKLYDNVDNIIIGKTVGLDYKSGYYDAVKKELYIKDIKNIESIYLRILYVITTSEISSNTYSVGYSTSTLSKANYKIIHNNFGINRAVVSNLVCRLLYTIPETLSIVPSYRNYNSDFFGNKIKSDNDIYSVEGKILSQICYTLDLDEEELYNNLFSSSPSKYLLKFFSKAKVDNLNKLLLTFDNISRLYSNYNKLCFLNSKLNENYINIKKNILNNDVEEYRKEEKNIKLAIEAAIIKLSPEKSDNDEDLLTEASLSEKINELEDEIIKAITKLQNFLVSLLIEKENKYSNIIYAIKLKKLDSLLLMPNKNLKNALHETITYKLLSNGENTASNLIEKIKYSIVNEVISTEKYIKIYKSMYFKKLEGLGVDSKTSIVALNIDNEFMQLIEINSLNKVAKNLNNNTKKIQLESLGYLLNNPSAMSSNIQEIEKIITNIRNFDDSIKNIKIENIYITDYYNFKIIVIRESNKFSILKLSIKDGKNVLKKIKLTENYSIFEISNSNKLPLVYKEKTPLKRILSFFGIL